MVSGRPRLVYGGELCYCKFPEEGPSRVMGVISTGTRRWRLPGNRLVSASNVR